MATKKTDKSEAKESKFYIVKTIHETKEKIEDTLKNYNEKYVKKQIETSKEFVTELKTDPKKRIDDLIGDSKDAFEKAKSTRVETMQKKVNTTKKDVQEKIEKMNEKSQRIYKGIENDAKLIFEDLIALGKKNIDKIPMKKTIQEKITTGIDSIPLKLNLPSKSDIEDLVTGIDGVNKKVDALNKEYARA